MWSPVYHWSWPNHHYFFPFHSIHLSIFTSYFFLLMKFNFEVSLTSLLRELNFLSPLTRPADVLTTSSWSNIFLKTRIIDVFPLRSGIKQFQIVLDQPPFKPFSMRSNAFWGVLIFNCSRSPFIIWVFDLEYNHGKWPQGNFISESGENVWS